MPKERSLIPICFAVIAVRTVLTATLTAIPSLEVVLCGKDPISFRRKIVIPFFQGRAVVHVLQLFVPIKGNSFQRNISGPLWACNAYFSIIDHLKVWFPATYLLEDVYLC